MINKRISALVGELTKEFNKERNLLSLTLVGSFSNLSKKIENFNDLDLVFLYRTIDKDNLNKLKKVADYLKKKYSTREVGITYTFNDGPIKVISKRPKTIMIHFLIYSNKSYERYQSNLTKYSFQQHKPLLGKSLKEINKLSHITSTDLFNNIDGILAMKHWIKTKSVTYIKPKVNGVEFKKISLGKKAYLEIIFYSVLNLANNILRLKKRYTNINEEMCEIFKKTIPINLSSFPEEVYKNKEKLRENTFFSDKRVKQISEQSLKFISECEEFLK